MEIATLFSTLLPSYEAIHLKGSLKKAADGISVELLPRYQQLQEVLGTVEGKKFHNKDVQEVSDSITEYLAKSGLRHNNLRQPSMLEYIIPAMQNVAALAAFLSKTIDRDMGRTIQTSVLTFNKATILQFVDIIDFTAQYASTLLNWITTMELASAADSNIATRALAPGDVELIHTKVVVFSIALRILGTPINRLQADYAEIPEAVFDEETYGELVKSFGQSKVDPLGMSAVPFPLSIVLRFQLWRAERQMDAYDECVQAAKSAEMRIILIRRQIAEGKGDAATEKLLEAYETQYHELKYERARLEKKYDLN